MTPSSIQSKLDQLTRHEGPCLLSAYEAFLKGILEAESEVALLAGLRRSVFGPLLDLARGAAAPLVRQHGLRVAICPDAGRSVTLALYAARAGKAAFAMLPNDGLDDCISILSQAGAESLDRGGALCLILEDHPVRSPATCPRRTAQRLQLPCLEAGDVGQLRDAVEHALRLARAHRGPVALVAHVSVLRSADTLEMRPNRMTDSVEAMLARRKRPRLSRVSEAGGALRAARRLEINRFRAIPSPGERVATGFITAGPANASLLHLTHVLGLHGRVPVLQLGLINPLDESAVGRMLTRCQHVIVLEPRPGIVEAQVIGAAEGMRRKGEQPAAVWGRAIPPDSNGVEHNLTSSDDLHPSILVRKIAHLLHAIRPTVQVASQLMAEPPPLPVPVAPRTASIGWNAQATAVRRILTDVDQWLRDRTHQPDVEAGPPTTLAIDGVEPASAAGRVVYVEVWEHRRFQREGAAALVQAARDDRPWVFVACESGAEDVSDLERLARGAIPADRADRVTLQTVNLSEPGSLRDAMRNAALAPGMTVIIVRDGPPPRFDVAMIEDSLTAIDRLGFEPRQRMRRSIDELCALRPPLDQMPEEPGNQLPLEAPTLETSFSIEPVTRTGRPRFRLHVRPLIEEVEVIRTKPPLWRWGSEGQARLAAPQPIHARHAQWRVHLAGVRREGPGLAAMALSEAGRHMGYHVRSLHDPTPVGAGRRAWAQVLFTSFGQADGSALLSPQVPFGEADLLIGLDARETLRALAPEGNLRVAWNERTSVVANIGEFGEDSHGEVAPMSPDPIIAAISAVTRPEPRLIEDFAAACRGWFHTDRVTDMALLGAAFQLGLVPVSVEAIESAIAAIESRGYGRCREAFEFGRRLSVSAGLFLRPPHDPVETVNRMARRLTLAVSRGAWGKGSRASHFARMLRSSLDATPGLAETELGRRARGDFVVACHRCLLWGGVEYANQFAELVTRLYLADRGDAGRPLTRAAILPLAHAMLIRDPLYVASVAHSREQRRITRELMNAKPARGDQIERRFLIRFELVALGQRVRGDVRTSDWMARLGAVLGRIVPWRWRGSQRQRDLRNYIIGCVKRALDSDGSEFDLWRTIFERLYSQAADDRLRDMAISEVKMLVESGAALGEQDALAARPFPPSHTIKNVRVETSDQPAGRAG